MRLRRSDCSGPGIRRRRRGRGFEFLDDEGGRVTDSDLLARIGELAIPPAWEEVWICPYPMGHLQATGADAAGRKQYLYHPKWRQRRDQEKFDDMLNFARALPRLRRRVASDLATEEMSRERVLACALRLLDRGFFRIGSEQYADQNDSYGLATMGKRHVHIDGDSVEFDYPAKSGNRRIHYVVDPEVRAVVAELKRRRGGGPELLAYRSGRRWVDVRSEDINERLKELAGAEFSAKTFRTWHATLLAALALAVSASASTRSATATKRAITRAVKEVAYYLGNTPAVCRASYIDPRVFDRFQSGWTIAGVLDKVGDVHDVGALSSQRAIERAVLDLLTETASPAVEKAA